MKKIGTILVLTILVFNLIAQTETARKIEHGVVINAKIESDRGLASKTKGFGTEVGYYLMKPISKKGILSVDFRLAYNQSEREYDNILNQEEVTSGDSTFFTRTGDFDYKGFAFSIPIKYRLKLKETSPFFMVIGTGPNFNIWNESNWKYDEFLWESNLDWQNPTTTFISEKRDQEENLKQQTFSMSLLLGLGYKKDRMMFELSLVGEGISFEDDFITSNSRRSLSLDFYYRLF